MGILSSRNNRIERTDLHGCLLPTVDPRVEVSGDEHVNIRVQGREEPPVHSEDLADVPGGWVAPHVADVEAGAAAREVTQQPQLRVIWLKVIINPDDPPGIVVRHQVEIVSNTLDKEGKFLIQQFIVHVSPENIYALCSLLSLDFHKKRSQSLSGPLLSQSLLCCKLIHSKIRALYPQQESSCHSYTHQFSPVFL